MVNIPTQFIFRKDLSDNTILEINNPSERISITPNSIISFGLAKNSENRFFLHYKVSSKLVEQEVYECNDAKKLLKCLRIFVKSTSESRKDSEDTASTKEKNLFSQMISFFGN